MLRGNTATQLSLIALWVALTCAGVGALVVAALVRDIGGPLALIGWHAGLGATVAAGLAMALWMAPDASTIDPRLFAPYVPKPSSLTRALALGAPMSAYVTLGVGASAYLISADGAPTQPVAHYTVAILAVALTLLARCAIAAWRAIGAATGFVWWLPGLLGVGALIGWGTHNPGLMSVSILAGACTGTYMLANRGVDHIVNGGLPRQTSGAHHPFTWEAPGTSVTLAVATHQVRMLLRDRRLVALLLAPPIIAAVMVMMKVLQLWQETAALGLSTMFAIMAQQASIVLGADARAEVHHYSTGISGRRVIAGRFGVVAVWYAASFSGLGMLMAQLDAINMATGVASAVAMAGAGAGAVGLAACVNVLAPHALTQRGGLANATGGAGLLAVFAVTIAYVPFHIVILALRFVADSGDGWALAALYGVALVRLLGCAVGLWWAGRHLDEHFTEVIEKLQIAS